MTVIVTQNSVQTVHTFTRGVKDAKIVYFRRILFSFYCCLNFLKFNRFIIIICMASVIRDFSRWYVMVSYLLIRKMEVIHLYVGYC